jgi:dihydrofolate synthase / folylpolyglutamate synthase
MTQVANPRAATTSELRQAASRTGTPLYEEHTVAAALSRAREVGTPQGIIVVTGSIFLVGEAMSAMGIPA